MVTALLTRPRELAQLTGSDLTGFGTGKGNHLCNLTLCNKVASSRILGSFFYFTVPILVQIQYKVKLDRETWTITDPIVSGSEL